jgi:hypothetical protein
MFSFIRDPGGNDRFTLLAVLSAVALLAPFGCGGGGSDGDNPPNPVDPETISGQIFYSGAFSSQVYSNQNLMRTLQVFAYEDSAVAREADVTLSNSPSPGILYTVSNPSYGASSQWVYELNPYLMPELSVSGSYANGDTLIQTGDDYIPPGNYQVIAFMELHPALISTDTFLAGFAENLAEINDTGDDAGGVNITLHDTIEIGGNVAILSFGDDVDSTTAMVKILGWPFAAPVSNQVIGSDSAVWIYPAAPVGLPVALHGEPDPADAWTLMAVNRQYRILDTSDAWPNEFFEQRVIQRSTMDSLPAMAGTTIDPTRAQILGSISTGAWSGTWDDELPLKGVTVTISTGDQVQYMYSDFSFDAPFTQGDMDPQFAIFNVDPPPDGKATITFSHPDSSIVIDSVTVPVRADEMTLFTQEEVSDPGELALGVTISGEVVDAETGDPAGSGVTMTLTYEDGTVLGTTLTDTNSEYFFNNVPSMLPVYLTGSGTGYVPFSIPVFPAHTTVPGEFPIDGFLMFSENLAVGLTSLIPGINEPSWNSTIQSNSWFLLEALDSSSSWDEIAGVTFSTSAPDVLIYYWDDAADMYTSTGPTRGYSTDEMGVQAIGYAPSSSAGLFSFNATGTVVDSVNVVLTPGEMLLWSIEE